MDTARFTLPRCPAMAGPARRHTRGAAPVAAARPVAPTAAVHVAGRPIAIASPRISRGGMQAGSRAPVLPVAPMIASRPAPARDVSAGAFDAATAWSVSSSNLAPQLFQFSLIPYLAFLYLIGRKDVGTPPLANNGFRFLLLFVFATIPAGVLAKNNYGDILANVDVYHGTSESLLTITNILIAVGFRQALQDAAGTRKEGGAKDLALFGATAAGVAGLIYTHVAGLDTQWAVAVGSEPSNALSLPTWAVHVSSVSEYLLAMSYIWTFAEATGNPRWKGLVWGMTPSLAGAFTACTFHLFYNAQPGLTPMVPLQAGLTLLGNTTCAIAAARLAFFPASEGEIARGAGVEVEGGQVTEVAKWVAPEGTEGEFLFGLLLLSATGAGAIKYGEAAAHASEVLPQSFPLAAAVVLTATVLGARSVMSDGAEGGKGGEEAKEGGFDKDELMANIKSKGLAGTLAYVITELAFWAVALPGAAIGYHSTTGEWLSWDTDRAQLVGIAAAFVTGVRFLVPVRMGAALALIPFVEENVVRRFGLAGGGGSDEGGGAGTGA